MPTDLRSVPFGLVQDVDAVLVAEEHLKGPLDLPRRRAKRVTHHHGRDERAAAIVETTRIEGEYAAEATGDEEAGEEGKHAETRMVHSGGFPYTPNSAPHSNLHRFAEWLAVIITC
jgi:hypothetical protein